MTERIRDMTASPKTAEQVQNEVNIANEKSHRGTHRASRSLSRRARISFCRTGPFTLRMMLRLVSSKNSTRTWVTPPREPVLPRT